LYLMKYDNIKWLLLTSSKPSTCVLVMSFLSEKNVFMGVVTGMGLEWSQDGIYAVKNEPWSRIFFFTKIDA